jgi:hypothetical protein
MKPSEIAELFVELQDESDFPNWHEPRSTLARAYLRLREAAAGIEDYNSEHHLDTICGPCMRMVNDALREALEETEE